MNLVDESMTDRQSRAMLAAEVSMFMDDGALLTIILVSLWSFSAMVRVALQKKGKE